MLLVGHSLGDSSLKNYLRRNHEKRPANHHYLLHWMPHSDSMSETRRQDIFEANLELYNLITIFLTSEEIRELFKLLNQSEREVRDFLDDQQPDKRSNYHFYIAGPVAAGKSTLIEQLRCFNTFEEWTRPPPKLMYRSADQLSAEEKAEVDDFLWRELKEKNRRMEQAPVGFHFMDRAPLDLYAFSKDDNENKDKTQNIRNIVIRDSQLKNGAVVFITASGKHLVQRNLKRGRDPETSGTDQYLEKQSDKLKDIYSPNIELLTDELCAGELARRVARIALLENYSPVDLQKIMDRFS